jgi:hypothetical protein
MWALARFKHHGPDPDVSCFLLWVAFVSLEAIKVPMKYPMPNSFQPAFRTHAPQARRPDTIVCLHSITGVDATIIRLSEL